LLEVDGKPYFVLDAKGTNEDILSGKNVNQARYYAIHHEVRVDYYGLCNGKQFTVFHVSETELQLILNIVDIDDKIQELAAYLLPDADQRNLTTDKHKRYFDYLSLKPLEEVKDVQKQSARRHYGVHGYFTKQSWDIVQAYINHFTQKGDLVLDPFGGTGVTAIEAMVLGRKAIHIDLNPLSVFWVQTIIEPVNLTEFSEAAENVIKNFEINRPQNDNEVKDIISKYPLPKDLPLPKGADVGTVRQLFTPKQLAELALLKYFILEKKNQKIVNLLLLAFSGAITKLNLTYHQSEGRSEGRGNSGVFAYYRYRIAKEPVILDIVNVYALRIKKIVSAKKELDTLIAPEIIKQTKIIKGNAANLAGIDNESVDYIYTDPPYGKKIPYLDLSTMWNAWLDLDVTEDDYEKEAIEGGTREKSKSEYSDLITKSIQEMFRVLKWDRWMSFVFQHQDPRYWHLIVDTAEKIGFEYAGAVKQNNGQSSFKKRQNYFTVLSGQMIINFKKVRNPKSVLKGQLGMSVTDAIFNNIEAIIAKKNGATLEEIYNELVINGLELGYLDVLSAEYSDLTPLLTENFDFNKETNLYHLPSNKKFRSHVPLELRVRYFLISFLRRKEREGHFPTFDEIVFNIMPLLKNGVTPKNQDIKSVLEEIAVHQGSDRWRLSSGQMQLTLFNLT
jgi:DNA modification methylase